MPSTANFSQSLKKSSLNWGRRLVICTYAPRIVLSPTSLFFFSSSLQTLCMRAHVRKSCAGLLPRACVCTWQRRGREVITSVESQHARSLKEEKRVRGE